MKINTQFTLIGFAAIASQLAITSASGALVAFDGFEDYTTGNLNTQNGGTGWTGAWTADSAADVVSGGLSYSSGGISLDGGEQALSVTGTDDNIVLRGFDTTDLGNEIYFSFLVNVEAGGASDFFNVFLTNGTASGTDTTKNSPGQIGDLNTSGSDFGARLARNSGFQDSSGVSYSTGTTYLLVGRISTDGTSVTATTHFDLVELWVNPTSTIAGQADASVDSNEAGAEVGSITRLGMRTANVGSGDDIRFDEFRIGTSFESVVAVPEPATYAMLAGMFAFFSLALCRRCERC